MTSALFITAPAAALVAAVALLAYALRGRRADDHPYCRKCDFDLFGKPVNATVCSECGADLGRRRAVRAGRRACRRRPLALAVAVLVPCAGWLALLRWGTARGVDWQRHKPAWALAREADSKAQAVRDAALAELARRVAAGELGHGREGELVAEALDRQADPGRPWASGWGVLIESAHDAGRLTGDQWRRYLRQALPYRLTARPAAARDNALPMRLDRGPARMGTPGRFNLVQTFADHKPSGGPVRKSDGPDFSPSMELVTWTPLDLLTWPPEQPADGSRTFLLFLNPRALAEMADGPQAVGLTVDAEFIDSLPSAAGSGRWTVRFELAAPFRLEPAGAVTGRPVADPALRQRVLATLSADPVDLAVEHGQLSASVSVTARDPPVGLGVGTWVRAGGHEWPAMGGTFSTGLTQWAGIGTPGGDLAAAKVDAVDLVLRPDRANAERLVELEYWGEEVILKDVPVRRR